MQLFSECKQDNPKSFNFKKFLLKAVFLPLKTNFKNYTKKMKCQWKSPLLNIKQLEEIQQKENEEKEKQIDLAIGEETIKIIRVLKTMKKVKIDFLFLKIYF